MTEVKKIYPVAELVKTFPASNCEAKWNTQEIIDFAPHYAVRLAVGANVINRPGGMAGLVSVCLQDAEYILHEDDFRVANTLKIELENSFLRRRGYPLLSADLGNHFRNNPDLIFQALRFLMHRVGILLELDSNDVRIGWLNQDRGGCGYFRCKLPLEYLRTFSGVHVDELSNFSYHTSAFYDAIVFHRIPQPQTILILQKLKAEGKILIYECDDDLFNVPNWNPASKYVKAEEVDRAVTCMRIADILVTTTQYLASRFREENATQPIYVCRNLVNAEFYKYYKPVYTKEISTLLFKKKIVIHNNRPHLYDMRMSKVLSPISDLKDVDTVVLNVVWFGSNTHDKDLEKIISTVKWCIEEYGLGVQFFFFGYCPPEFLDIVIAQGNTDPRYTVKEQYAHSLHYIPAVPHAKFGETLASLQPDIGLCPLDDCEFNNAKSALKMLEFAAMGVPVITSDVGPYQDLIMEAEDKQPGKQIALIAGNAEEWKVALRILISKASMRKELGTNAYDFMNQYYRWSTDSAHSHKNAWHSLFADIINTVRIRKADLQKDDK